MSHKGILSDIDAPTAENRGTLYMWMREVIAITQPKIFIAENNEFDSSNHKNSSYDGWYLSRFACGDRGYSVISF